MNLAPSSTKGEIDTPFYRETIQIRQAHDTSGGPLIRAAPFTVALESGRFGRDTSQ
jgi:hypothetical protein